MADMLAYDVSKWQASEIPESSGLMDQRMLSLDSAGKWLLDSLVSGGFSSEIWEDQMTSSELMKSYHGWCSINRIGEYEIYTYHRMGRYLRIVFGEPERTTKNMLLGTWYSLGDLETARNLFKKKEKVYF
jgi:hypothetical protein